MAAVSAGAGSAEVENEKLKSEVKTLRQQQEHLKQQLLVAQKDAGKQQEEAAGMKRGYEAKLAEMEKALQQATAETKKVATKCENVKTPEP